MEFLTPASMAAAVSALLCALLVAATWSDIRRYRIPNALVYGGALLGLALNTFLPEGNGFASALPGALGWRMALYGLGLGLAIMLPLYMLHAMGAGDVKLVAMIGAFLGPHAIVYVIAFMMLAGGLLAIVYTLRTGSFRRMWRNLQTMMLATYFKAALHEAPVLDAVPDSAGRLPYAIAIALGTFIYLGLAALGHRDVFYFYAWS
ncbi:MAG TPA: prepilin peptidase [Noviherbaspirillum sp.]|uniref:A24 family peptidase n=1 Tax=Noviherbaspirillum sp. TaxID=1926288 RepID=UPI002B480C95|nr:prepilin peptidase [Noviherbaspirillum sp.]HJV84024.1 prepilin peptidase [Noviherbaspirillum sp.]